MSGPRTFVFLGPTLQEEAARALCPEAVLLPPVQMGDVYALVRRRRPARIAIIDGYFERVAAVWHKEILFALERGVEVLGAASMGALRAAELHPFGMIGVGRVFTAFQIGRLVDDDEVAIAHGPAEFGYPRASEAMVNLRHGLTRALSGRIISGRTHDRLIDLGRAMFYRERAWDSLIEAGRAARLPRRELTALASFVARTKPDLKAADARLLLRRLAVAPRRPPVPRDRPTLARTWFWHRLVELAAPPGS
jgi:hypothetical protein